MRYHRKKYRTVALYDLLLQHDLFHSEIAALRKLNVHDLYSVHTHLWWIAKGQIDSKLKIPYKYKTGSGHWPMLE